MRQLFLWCGMIHCTRIMCEVGRLIKAYVVELRFLHVSSCEINSTQVCIAEISLGKIRPAEYRSTELSPM